MLILVFSVNLRLLPTSGSFGPEHLVLPSITLSGGQLELIGTPRADVIDVRLADANTIRASISTTDSFANSAGWPSRFPPMVSQPLTLSAVPPPDPRPGMSTAISNTMASA